MFINYFNQKKIEKFRYVGRYIRCIGNYSPFFLLPILTVSLKCMITLKYTCHNSYCYMNQTETIKLSCHRCLTFFFCVSFVTFYISW